MLVVYAISVWWGVCLKTASGWYGGMWAGRVWLGYSRTPFMSPGVETGRFAVPFGFGFERLGDGVREIVGAPIWWLIAPLALLLAWVWWRYAVYQTIRSKHGTLAPVVLIPKAAEGSGGAAL